MSDPDQAAAQCAFAAGQFEEAAALYSIAIHRALAAKLPAAAAAPPAALAAPAATACSDPGPSARAHPATNGGLAAAAATATCPVQQQQQVQQHELSKLYSNRSAALLELGRAAEAATDARAAIAHSHAWHRPYIRLCLALLAQRPAGMREAAADALHAGLAACTSSGAPSHLAELHAMLEALHAMPAPAAGPPPKRSRQAPPPAATAATGAAATAIPVVVVCGFLGSGKTTLLRHLLASMPPQQARRAALVVNDLAPLNVDAEMLLGGQPAVERSWQAAAAAPETASAAAATTEAERAEQPEGARRRLPEAPGVLIAPDIVELSNGCICCNLRSDLQQALLVLARRTPPPSLVLLEATGVAPPGEVAAGLEPLRPHGVEVGALVTVVDATACLELLAGGSSHCSGMGRAAAACSSAAAASGSGARPLAQLLADQIETADVILINKCDRLAEGAGEDEEEEGGVGSQEEGAGEREHWQQVQPARHPQSWQAGAPPPLATPEVGAKPAGPLNGDEQQEEQQQQAQDQQQQRRRQLQVRLGRQRLAAVRAAVRALNPDASIINCVRCEVELHNLLLAKEHGGAESSTSGSTPGAPQAAAAATKAADDGGSQPPATAVQQQQRPEQVAHRAHEEDDYGINSCMFRSRRPFHPGRLWQLLQHYATPPPASSSTGTVSCTAAAASLRSQEADRGRTQHDWRQQHGSKPQGVDPGAIAHEPPPPLLRAKGVFWLASMPQAIWELSLAGGSLEIRAAGRWLCTMVDPEHWPVHRQPACAARGGMAHEGAANGSSWTTSSTGDPDPDPHRAGPNLDWGDNLDAARGAPIGSGPGGAGAAWHPVWGDRQCGLALIGIGLSGAPAEAMLRSLRGCLLSAAEEAEGEAAWGTYDDAPWLTFLEQY